jgi:hypothetical protein
MGKEKNLELEMLKKLASWLEKSKWDIISVKKII